MAKSRCFSPQNSFEYRFFWGGVSETQRIYCFPVTAGTENENPQSCCVLNCMWMASNADSLHCKLLFPCFEGLELAGCVQPDTTLAFAINTPHIHLYCHEAFVGICFCVFIGNELNTAFQFPKQHLHFQSV